MRSYTFLMIAGVFMVVIGGFSCVLAKVSVRVLEDVYVLPVAELASTKTYPEILEIENDIIKITLIPNRGRVLSSYVLRKEEAVVPILYQNFVPKPMILPSGLHVVEFGGYYLSLPWNTRDRQPLDLAFALTQVREDLVEVFLSGKDMFEKTLTECWVRVRDHSPLVEVELKITNTSRKGEKALLFKDFTITNVDDNSRVILPVGTVKVLESRNNWIGEPGKILSWPAEFSSWNRMDDYLRFATVGSLVLPCVALLYPERGVAFVKFWEPEEFFSDLEVWSWGRSWLSEPGADAYVVISSLNSNLILKPQEWVSFKVYFTALEGVSQTSSPQELLDQARLLLP